MEYNIRELLETAAKRAIDYRENTKSLTPYPQINAQQLRHTFDTGLNQHGRPGKEVIEQLADAAEPGLVGISSEKFFGWVMGSSHPVGVAADWLTAGWAQNSAIYQTSPSAAIAEEVSGKWLIDLLGLPSQSSFGFTTGATMASFICLAAARSEALRRYGWDLEADGMFGAPEVTVFLSAEAHATIFAGLRYLGFGKKRLVQITADNEGCMDTDDLANKLSICAGPKIIIAQAGHINSAAFDDFVSITRLAQANNAWLHVDGAFGLWAQSSPLYSHLCEGVDLADSWSVDGHKLLQVPYDSGYAIIKNRAAHQRAMATSASYLNEAAEDGRNPTHFVPELSRRARGFALWAILQTLGREGVAALVEENCRNASHLEKRFSVVHGIKISHKVHFNQLAICFEVDCCNKENDALTLSVVRQLQNQQNWFLKEAEWKGRTVMRISLSSLPNSLQQIDELADAVIEAFEICRQNVVTQDNNAPSELTSQAV